MKSLSSLKNHKWIYFEAHLLCSKFIPPDSKVIKIVTDCKETKLMAVAVTTPQNSIAVVILNRYDSVIKITFFNKRYNLDMASISHSIDVKTDAKETFCDLDVKVAINDWTKFKI